MEMKVFLAAGVIHTKNKITDAFLTSNEGYLWIIRHFTVMY